jgi:hypothetical protein
MAKKKAQRTTLRSSKGTKLYAVRKADGTFKDIQTYKRAHTQDMQRQSAAEMAVHEGTKVEPAPGVTLPGMTIPIPTPGSAQGSPITSPIGSAKSTSKKPTAKKAAKPLKKAAPKKADKKAAPKKAAKKVAPAKKKAKKK